MRVLACVKRVPAPGAKIVLTADAQDIDTRHLGFTTSPHEECAVEEAVRLVERHGGSSTVLTLGAPSAEEQLRYAISMGVDDGALIATEDEWDPQATAAAIAEAVGALEADGGPFDLLLFGAESADAANCQVAIRVAHALGRPIASGIKGIEVEDGTVSLRRGIPGGYERYALPLPAAVAVKEGLNLPRYPAMRGRLRAKKARVRVLDVTARPGGLRKLGLRRPPEQETDTVLLGSGAAAAGAIADMLEELGLV
jgi:electron transfer flavoprotein beta subunit